MRVINRGALLGFTAALGLTLLTVDLSFAGNAYDGHVKCEGKNCQVDLFLMRGFRAFSQCQVCHGIDGSGSSFAPSLNGKLQEIDRATFDDRVANGFTGQIGIMPPWKTNPNVMKYIDNLYAYLMARSDGVLPPGRLKRFDRDQKTAAPEATPVSMSGMSATAVMNTTSGGMSGMSGMDVTETPTPTTSGFGSRDNLK